MSASPILLIDNYDSFVFNLARYFQELGAETTVRRNDQVSLDLIREMSPSAIVISPGPCTPDEAGISLELVRAFYSSIPILGVCLGHQSIAQALGGKIIKALEPYHGRSSEIEHQANGLFSGCPQPLQVARYHSLIVEEKSLASELTVTSRTQDRLIMSLQHETYPVFGVQFHPESILTNLGHRLLKNFLEIAGILNSDLMPRGDRFGIAESADDFYQRQIENDAWRPL